MTHGRANTSSPEGSGEVKSGLTALPMVSEESSADNNEWTMLEKPEFSCENTGVGTETAVLPKDGKIPRTSHSNIVSALTSDASSRATETPMEMENDKALQSMQPDSHSAEQPTGAVEFIQAPLERKLVEPAAHPASSDSALIEIQESRLKPEVSIILSAGLIQRREKTSSPEQPEEQAEANKEVKINKRNEKSCWKPLANYFSACYAGIYQSIKRLSDSTHSMTSERKSARTVSL